MAEAKTRRVHFKSGKKVDLKKCTGFKKRDDEWFTNEDGTKYQAPAYVFFFGKGKGVVHYKQSKVDRVETLT